LGDLRRPVADLPEWILACHLDSPEGYEDEPEECPMTLDQLVSPLVAVTLVTMMVSIGLSVPLSEVAEIAKKPSIVVRALLANYLFFPLIAVLLLVLFHARPLVAAGFLILAVCPGAPYAPSCTALARGNVALAVGLMVILAGSSVVVSPLLLRALLAKLGGGEDLTIDAGRIVRTLLVTQLVPLFLGLAARRWHPTLAARLRKPFAGATKVLNLLVVVLVVVTHFHTLREIRLVGLAGMLILLLASLAIGWLSGGPGIENRKAVAETTSLRNAGVGLVIASTSFAGTAALTAVLVYSFVSIAGSFAVALVWGRLVASKAH
jgi:BASS family bile acid:Na+ symporter